MKIGLIGGMFDPVHIGHLDCARHAAKLFDLKKVIFIPTAVSPHRKPAIASAEQRLAMVRIALMNKPNFEISRIEIDSGFPSYTIDTIRAFWKIYGSDIFFILGMDAFREIHFWKRADELLKSCNFIVISRSGQDESKVLERLQKKFGRQGQEPLFKKTGPGKHGNIIRYSDSPFRIYFCSPFETDVSSSRIRKLLRKEKDIKYLVPKGVEQYIMKEEIYRK